MSLDRLPLPAFLGGLAALAAALLVLHLLRVRLRRVPVDSLLFFARLGTVQKPRVLPGRPARWLAYALALLALAGLWSAFAGLSQPADGPSRVVLLDAGGTAVSEDGSVWTARAETARALLEEGLGPEGAVLAFADDLRWSLEAEVPAGLLDARTEGAVSGGAGTGVFAALRAARARLQGRDGDEIVVLGGPPHLPASWDGVPVRRRAVAGAPPALGVVDFEQEGTGIEVLVSAPSACTVKLFVSGQLHDERTVTPSANGTARVTFTDLPADRGGVVEVRLACDGRQTSSRTMWRPLRPVPVHLDDVPAAVSLAVAADPGFVAATEDEARVVLTSHSDRELDRPALVFVEQTAPAPRAPATTDACPLPLSLRDRAQTAPALRAEPDEEVWVVDGATGAPLVTASGDGPRRVRAARWLLEPLSHRDVPILVIGALRWLAPADETPPFTPSVAPRPVPADPAPEDPEREAGEGLAVEGRLPAVVLLLAVLLLLADAVVYHRGRMP